MFHLLQDLRFGLRMLRRNAGITFVAWLSLSLGIGAWTAVFTVVDGLLIKSPYAEADRLVMVWESDLHGVERRMGSTSLATFDDWLRETTCFEALSALSPTNFTLTDDGRPEPLFTRLVTASYFPVFGIDPILGRIFTEEEEEHGAQVVVLSHGLWQRRFGGDPEVLGRRVEFTAGTYEVVGVMPEFYGPLDPTTVQLWAPLTRTGELDRRQRRLAVWGRLARGLSIEEARADMDRVALDLRGRYPEVMGGRGARLRPASEIMLGDLRPAILVFFGVGGLVLLMICGNLAHLLLVRMHSRLPEMAVRTALGAGRWQLARQLVTESLLLTLAGAGSGLLLAQAGVQALKARVPIQFGLPRFDSVAIDGRALLVTLAVTLLVTVVFSLIPARRFFFGGAQNEDLKAGTRSIGGRRGPLRGGVLVVTEVAFVLVLLITTSLMVQSFLNLRRVAPGHDPAHVLTLRTGVTGEDYQTAAARVDFFERAQQALAALPGVESVGATDLYLLRTPRVGTRFVLRGAPAAEEGSEPSVFLQVVTPTYFEAMGIPLLEGRSFQDQDTVATTPVAMVNRLFRDSFLRGPEALHHLQLVGGGEDFHEIVGVSDNVRTFNYPPDPVPTIYVPHAQNGGGIMTFVVRTRIDPQSLVQSAQDTLADLDPFLPTFRVKSLEEIQSEADWRFSISAVLLGLSAALALVLAVTGIYAVMAFSVSERTREIGIRMAFGAEPGSLLRDVIGRGFRLAALGLGLGLVAALALSRLIESMVYGVSGRDPATFVIFSLLVVVVLLLASFVAARRVLSVDPMAALRQE